MEILTGASAGWGSTESRSSKESLGCSLAPQYLWQHCQKCIASFVCSPSVPSRSGWNGNLSGEFSLKEVKKRKVEFQFLTLGDFTHLNPVQSTEFLLRTSPDECKFTNGERQGTRLPEIKHPGRGVMVHCCATIICSHGGS